MSGITGIINLDGKPIDRALLERMTGAMAFRGPDAQNVWSEGCVGLGHALLRTTFEAQDERGPCSLDGQVWLTADARVDGRADLIRKLRAQGRTVSDKAPDPELILHAYHAWGEECLDHLIGDFSFALWDGRRRRLFCARDHFGVTPFYYAHMNHTLVFGNTLQAVLLCPDISDELNEQAIGDYLIFRYSLDLSATTFADVQRLPPAHRLTYSAADSTLHLRRYWTMPERDGYLHYKNPDDYVEQFAELFRQAVTDRLRIDRISVAMSGGMDSPAVAAVAHRAMAAQEQALDLQAITFTHTLVPYEEMHYAGLVAEAVGFPIHYLDMDARFDNEPPDLPELVPPEPSFFFAWCLNPWGEMWARAASADRVLLTGYGGDPAMRSSISYWSDLLKRRQFGQIAADMRQYARRYGRRPPLYLRANLRRWLGRSGYRRPYPAWLNPDFGARLDLQARMEDHIERRWEYKGLRKMADSPFWSNLLSNFDPGNTFLPFKTRFPFFDLRLVAYLLLVPPTPWFEGKRLLRESMCGILPEPVRRRPKSPLLTIPARVRAQQQGIWPWVESLISMPELAGYVDQAALLQVLRSPGQADDSEYRGLAQPLTLAYWLHHRQKRPRNSVSG